MSFKAVITANVVSETLSKIVSLLSSASLNLSSEQIKNLVVAKIGNTKILFAENNDIGYCVSRLLNNCAYKNISSLEELNNKYNEIREDDELVTETIDMMAEGIAKHISPVLYELREIIPQETRALVNEINTYIPAIEALKEKEVSVRVFNWGKLNSPNVVSTTMLIAQDKANCFKDGVVRQHDSANVLRRVPYGSVQKLDTNSDFRTSLVSILQNDITTNITDEEIKSQLLPHIELAIGLITSDRVYTQTLNSYKEILSANSGLSAGIVYVVDRIDAIEDILRRVTYQYLIRHEVGAALAAKAFSNIETVLTNISLLRASMIFHKVHTLQSKLILAPNVVQESALTTFKEAGGTDQMIKDHFTYMELNDLVNIPTNGLSLDVVLNSSAKARAVVQKNSELLSSRATARKVKALQDAVSYGLELHYKKASDAGIYKPTLEAIHKYQVSRSVSALLKKSVDDIALEYLVTLRHNKTMTSFFGAINNELLSLVKNETAVSQEMIQEAVCSGVVSVIFDSLVKDFSVQKEAA